MATRANSDKREYALMILARMIVRAYLGEIDRGEAGPNAYRDESHIGNGDDEPFEDSETASGDK